MPPKPSYEGPVKPKSYTYIDLILLPLNEILPNNTKDLIKWLDFQNYHHVQPVDMGEGNGFHWFACATIPAQEIIREKLGLSGGDDRLQLLVNGLAIKDEGNYTINSTLNFLHSAGEKALPYIKAAIEDNMDSDPYYQIQALAPIQCNEVTELLKSLYASKNQIAYKAAMHALVFIPNKQVAKDIYFDMLRHNKYVSYISPICLQFEWKDAVPLLKDVCANPPSWDSFCAAFETYRALEEKPIPEESKDAEKIIKRYAYATSESTPSEAQIYDAKEKILGSSDQEAAAFIAVRLAIYAVKATKEKVDLVNATGIEMLKQLPAKNVKPILKVLQVLQSQEHWNPKTKELLAQFPD
jgi:hypothetical protein